MTFPMNQPYMNLINRARIALGDAAFGIPWERISVVLDDRMRTCGGTSTYRFATKQATVKLNRQLFERLNDTERYEIISHELAHAILQVTGKSDKHGPRWQSLHQKMGGTAARCHTHEVQHNKVKRVVLERKTDSKLFLVTAGFVKHGINTQYSVVGVAKICRNSMSYSWERLENKTHEKTVLANKFKPT